MDGKKKSKKKLYVIFAIVLVVASINFIKSTINTLAIKSFKSLYSEYSKILNMTVYQMDGDVRCYFSSAKGESNDFSGCEDFYKHFTKSLKVSKYCKNNSLKNGCIPKYKSYVKTSACSGYSEKMMNNVDQAYLMYNGSNLIIFNMPPDSQNPIFAVDSNGKLPPNKSGYDLFSFVIMKNAAGEYYFHPNITYCLPKTKGGIQKLQDIYK